MRCFIWRSRERGDGVYVDIMEAHVEKHTQLNFLDVTLTRNEQQIQFDIYRIPTKTDTLIIQDSNYPTRTQQGHEPFFYR